MRHCCQSVFYVNVSAVSSTQDTNISIHTVVDQTERTPCITEIPYRAIRLRQRCRAGLSLKHRFAFESSGGNQVTSFFINVGPLDHRSMTVT